MGERLFNWRLSRKVAFLGFILLSITLVITSGTASADWQYTKWGMTKAQVIVASGHTTSSTDSSEWESRSRDPNDVALLKAPFKAGRFEFTAYFLFDRYSEKLTEVYLELNGPDTGCQLLNSLTRKYGKPYDTISDVLMEGARWNTKVDAIDYLGVGRVKNQTDPEKVRVRYEPRDDDENKGL